MEICHSSFIQNKPYQIEEGWEISGHDVEHWVSGNVDMPYHYNNIKSNINNDNEQESKL